MAAKKKKHVPFAQPPTKKGRRPPPPNETPHERFLRLGQQRLQDVLVGLRLLGQLNSQRYEIHADDLVRMRYVLNNAVNELWVKLTPKVLQTAEQRKRFRFPVAD